MKTLGAFHQTYYKKFAFKMAYNQFRKHFPDSPYVILSDCGDDFSEYQNDKTFFIKSELRNYGGGSGAVRLFTNPENDYVWIDWYERIKKACELCQTDYLIMMEDDVLIKSNFKIDFDFDICGPTINKLDGMIIKFIENIVGYKISGWYGFNGGCMLNCKTYLQNYDNLIQNFKKYHKIYTDNYQNLIALAGDANTMIQFYLLGKEYSSSPWYGKEIIHPYKAFYTEEELPQNR